MNIPLSTFAFYEGDNSTGLCAIMVEYLDPTTPQSNNIILGSMFFQSFIVDLTFNPSTSS